MRRAAVLLSVGAALLAAGCGGSSASKDGAGTTTAIPELENIQQLRDTFNAHPGVPRLVVLVSPT